MRRPAPVAAGSGSAAAARAPGRRAADHAHRAHACPADPALDDAAADAGYQPAAGRTERSAAGAPRLLRRSRRLLRRPARRRSARHAARLRDVRRPGRPGLDPRPAVAGRAGGDPGAARDPLLPAPQLSRPLLAQPGRFPPLQRDAPLRPMRPAERAAGARAASRYRSARPTSTSSSGPSARSRRAYGARDLAALDRLATPEVVGFLAEELGQDERRGVTNHIADVKLLQGDVAESWREQEQDYATVAMRFGLRDWTTDNATGPRRRGRPRPAGRGHRAVDLRPPARRGVAAVRDPAGLATAATCCSGDHRYCDSARISALARRRRSAKA